MTWLKDSAQGSLELYNPLVMSKMFLLHDAKILDKFNSNSLFWIDAGLTNTVHKGYFTEDKVLQNIKTQNNKFYNIFFIAFDPFVYLLFSRRKSLCGFSFNIDIYISLFSGL